MNEMELEAWVIQTQLDLMKRIQTDSYYQFVLMASFVLFLIGYLSVLLLIPLLFMAIFVYKKTFDKLTLVRLTIKQFKELELSQSTHWYEQSESNLVLDQFELRIDQIAKLNERFGYRVLIYIGIMIILLIMN